MTATIQRPLRGSRISTFYPVKNLPSLASLDSAFQLQEYISLLIRLDVHDVDAIVALPGSGSGAGGAGSVKEGQDTTAKEAENKEQTENNKKEGQGEAETEGEKGKAGEVTVDEACWIYEQLRRLAQDLSHPLITTLQQECTRASCPEMKAGEWLYLCVAHGNDGAMEQCCAIDYILHTVDSATALLNSPRTFPSRLQIPTSSHRHFSSLARRLGRIFAHAYFHHREAFEQAEAESSLYARFMALTARFDLVPPEFLVIPVKSGLDLDSAPAQGESEEEGREYGYTPAQEQHRRYLQQLGQRQPLRGAKHQQGLYVHAQHPTQNQHPELNTNLNSNPRGPSPITGISGGIGEAPIPSSSSASFTPLSVDPLRASPIGDTPSPSGNGSGSGGRSRFGRNRTDTMVFADTEAGVVADELAARARERERLKSESESEDAATSADDTTHHAEPLHDDDLLEEMESGPKTARPGVEEEGETQFEISLSPEEEIGGAFASGDVDLDLEGEGEGEDIGDASMLEEGGEVDVGDLGVDYDELEVRGGEREHEKVVEAEAEKKAEAEEEEAVEEKTHEEKAGQEEGKKEEKEAPNPVVVEAEPELEAVKEEVKASSPPSFERTEDSKDAVPASGVGVPTPATAPAPAETEKQTAASEPAAHTAEPKEDAPAPSTQSASASTGTEKETSVKAGEAAVGVAAVAVAVAASTLSGEEDGEANTKSEAEKKTASDSAAVEKADTTEVDPSTAEETVKHDETKKDTKEEVHPAAAAAVETSSAP